MRTNDTGETHLGVVVRTSFAGLDSSSTTQDYMNSIYLISVNRSLRQVSLATWGNPAGGFGGFSLEPGKYHARRLLKKSETGELSAAGEKPGWELLDEYKVKLRSYYPPETEVPREFASIDLHNNSGTIDDEQNKRIIDGLVKGNVQQFSHYQSYYQRELPTTSISYRTDQRLFPTGNRAVVTQLSGWRNRVEKDEDSGVIVGHYANYHQGVDFARTPVLGDAGQKDVFLAPEDGIFYIWRSNDWDKAKEIPVYKSDKSQVGSLNAHSLKSYGYIGVLVTRPDDPKEGRVYLFAHMGGSGPVEGEVAFNADQLADYTNGTLDPTFPDGQPVFNIIKGQEALIANRYILNVKKGDKLGYVGSLGVGTDKHIHMEVHESFIENGNDVWCLVDPLSCFDTSLYRLTNISGMQDSYGWWSRIVGSWSNYDASRVVLTAFMTQNPIIDTTIQGAWFNTAGDYEYAHTWIYFYTELLTEISNYNTENGAQLDYPDIFREDRWDERKFYE